MISCKVHKQDRASISIVLILMTFLATSDAVPPRIWTSVDGYKSVCPEEQIYLTCFTNDSWSLSWTSLNYIGSKAAIEFNQDLDRPGVGKLVSLPNGRATLSQMTKTERSLSSDLKITIPDHLNETQVTCTNDLVEAVIKTFTLAREPPAPLTRLQTDIIAKNSTTGVSVFIFRWQLPTNIESIDLKYIKFQVDHQLPIILMGNTTEIILPLRSYEQHSVSIVAVDRCSRQSQPTVFYLGMIHSGHNIDGEQKIQESHHNGKSLESDISSAKDINTLNCLIILMVLSVFSLFFISL